MSEKILNAHQTLRLPVIIIAMLTLIVGVGFGIAALVGPLGVWFGSWDFRKGFSILRWVNTYASWFTYGCLAATVLVIVLALVGHLSVMRYTRWALVGVIAAALAWYIPETFRPATEVPPIHDITTDPDNPLDYVDVVPLRVDAPNTMVYGGSPNMTPEKLAQLQRDAYPQIQPQYYSASKDEIFDRVLALVDQSGWDLVGQDRATGRIEATDTTFWFRFKDDIVFKITDEGGQTKLEARSLSRVGVSDVGKNAARLTAFFEAMKAQ